MRLMIIRHGDPDYSIDSLTEKGWREAELLSHRMIREDVTAFYVSPLGRAKDTARPTLEKLGRTAEVCDFLREFNGQRRDPVTGERLPMWDLLPEDWTRHPENYDRDGWMREPTNAAGDAAAVYRRVCEGLDALLARHGYRREGQLYRVERENRDTVVLFCHFAVGCVLLSHLIGVSPVVLWHGMVAPPTSVTTLYTEERVQGIACFRCCGFGDISHLYAEGEPPAFAARFCETYSDFGERH